MTKTASLLALAESLNEKYGSDPIEPYHLFGEALIQLQNFMSDAKLLDRNEQKMLAHIHGLIRAGMSHMGKSYSHESVQKEIDKEIKRRKDNGIL